MIVHVQVVSQATMRIGKRLKREKELSMAYRKILGEYVA
jgi:hypothetical protein